MENCTELAALHRKGGTAQNWGLVGQSRISGGYAKEDALSPPNVPVSYELFIWYGDFTRSIGINQRGLVLVGRIPICTRPCWAYMQRSRGL